MSCRSRASVRVALLTACKKCLLFPAVLKETFLASEHRIKQSFLWQVLVQSSLCLLVGVRLCCGNGVYPQSSIKHSTFGSLAKVSKSTKESDPFY